MLPGGCPPPAPLCRKRAMLPCRSGERPRRLAPRSPPQPPAEPSGRRPPRRPRPPPGSVPPGAVPRQRRRLRRRFLRRAPPPPPLPGARVWQRVPPAGSGPFPAAGGTGSTELGAGGENRETGEGRPPSRNGGVRGVPGKKITDFWKRVGRVLASPKGNRKAPRPPQGERGEGSPRGGAGGTRGRSRSPRCCM